MEQQRVDDVNIVINIDQSKRSDSHHALSDDKPEKRRAILEWFKHPESAAHQQYVRHGKDEFD
jgi:hypothetical protein